MNRLILPNNHRTALCHSLFAVLAVFLQIFIFNGYDPSNSKSNLAMEPGILAKISDLEDLMLPFIDIVLDYDFVPEELRTASHAMVAVSARLQQQVRALKFADVMVTVTFPNHDAAPLVPAHIRALLGGTPGNTTQRSALPHSYHALEVSVSALAQANSETARSLRNLELCFSVLSDALKRDLKEFSLHNRPAVDRVQEFLYHMETLILDVKVDLEIFQEGIELVVKLSSLAKVLEVDSTFFWRVVRTFIEVWSDLCTQLNGCDDS